MVGVIFGSPDSYRDFDRAVRREFRYVRTPDQEAFLEALRATSSSRTLLMEKGNVLWRAQLGHGWQKFEQDGEVAGIPWAYAPERMKPLVEKASDGRANSKGIACLYLATDKTTSMLEVRPLIGSYVSVAEFELVKDLCLVNCSLDTVRNLERFFKKTWILEELEKTIWSYINRAFSEPVERGDNDLSYIPTQIMTECFRMSEFDGVAYRSSQGETGLNVALFDVGSANLISCALHRVNKVSVEWSDEHEPYFIKRVGSSYIYDEERSNVFVVEGVGDIEKF